MQHQPRARRHTESSIPAALGCGSPRRPSASPSPPQHVPDPLGEMSGLAQALMSDQRRFAAAAAMQQQQQQLSGGNNRTERLSFDSADAPPPHLHRGYSRSFDAMYTYGQGGVGVAGAGGEERRGAKRVANKDVLMTLEPAAGFVS